MNEGWKCPGCGCCYAPFVTKCPRCPQKALYTPKTAEWDTPESLKEKALKTKQRKDTDGR